MPSRSLLSICLALPCGLAFPSVLRMHGVDSSMLELRASSITLEKRDSPLCPNGLHQAHVPAAPITSQFPYNGAINGQPGNGKGGYPVPAPGDTLHRFKKPTKYDIRGPCPGLNTAANHGFIARDGITTFNELVDMQQNVYNVDYATAVVLATLGVGFDGDLLGSQKLSIGCDANSRTALAPALADELGLNGHNQFEGDVSLTRNDYFTAVDKGDNYKFNTTLFTMMMNTCNGNCSLDSLGEYRYQRYLQSRAENGNFFFGPLSLLLYGAATFLYELMPGQNSLGTGTEKTMMSFFGAKKDKNGNYYWNNSERLPPGYIARVQPYSSVVQEALKMYNLHPVDFGGNFGPGNFNGMNYPNYIQNGQLLQNATLADAMCQIFQNPTAGVPTQFGLVFNTPIELETAIANQVAPYLANFGCPDNFLSGNSTSGDPSDGPSGGK